MAKRGYKFQEFVAHAADVNCLNIGKKSSRVFVTGGSDRMVNLWRFDTSNSLLSLSGHTTSVQSVTFDSAEVLVLAGASNGTIKLWDLEEGKSIRTVMGHRSSCASIEFHPFGEFFASGSMDTDLKIWDIRKKGSIHTYKGHTRGIKTIKFTPDGRWVVTGGEDNSVKIWDLTAGKLLHDFKFHKGMISCIDFHPHEFLLATGSADRTVKFWDLETFELIGSSGPEATGIHSIVFHPDGKTLFCASDEALKVLSWEPIRCHDAVEMGWSSLADLIIYEGKLLGCSYHQSRVGIWIADISLIGPYAIGLGPNKNSLLEPMSSHMETSSIGLIGNDLKSISLLATVAVGTKVELGGLPISSKECSQSPLRETDSIYSTSISSISNEPKERTFASSQIVPNKKDSEFSSTTYSSTPFRVAKAAETSAKITKSTVSNYLSRDRSPSTNTLGSNTSLSSSSAIKDLHTVKKHQEFFIPVIVPRNHVSHDTTSSSRAACSNSDLLAYVSGSPSLDSRSSDFDSDDQSQLVGAEFGTSSGLTSNQNSRNYSSKSRHVEAAETPEAGDCNSTSIRYVAEKIERIMLPEQPATLENEKSEESVSSSNGHCSVKYVRGVAVQLGKTRSLVERFERRESVGLSAAKGKEMELEEDSLICDHLLQRHDAFINSLKSRLTKIQVVRHFWEFNGIKAAVDAAVKLPDHSVQIDFVSALREKLELFTLDIFLCLLPLLLGLVNSKTERHVTVSLEMLCELVKIFGPVVSSTLSAASYVGVDLHAEERCLRSKQCHKYLEKIKQILPSVIRRGGIQAKHAEKLNILLQAS